MIEAVAMALAMWASPSEAWATMAEDERERWRAGARVAVAAMREPTRAMIRRGEEDAYLVEYIWRYMVDAALAEEWIGRPRAVLWVGPETGT